MFQPRTGLFRLTPRILDLGFTFLSTMRLPDVAQATMEEVVATVHESCSITVLDGMDIVYVARVPTKLIMAIALAVGRACRSIRLQWDGCSTSTSCPQPLMTSCTQAECVPTSTTTRAAFNPWKKVAKSSCVVRNCPSARVSPSRPKMQ